MLFQSLGDGDRANRVTDILESSLDLAVTQANVLKGHVHDVPPDLFHDPRPSLSVP